MNIIAIRFLVVKAALKFLLLFALLVPATLFAQWPNYPSKGVPRTKDGKPDLTGPVPKAADGHPDLSGIWDYYRERPANAAPRPVDSSLGLTPAPAAGGIQSPFFNLGLLTKDGIPFTPWALDLRKSRMSGNNQDNPDAHCLPIGLTQLHQHPQPRKIIQTPNLIVILYEAQGGVRQIFMDGRPLPKDPQPWWYGYSIGHWDGDTLVVETTGFRDDVWLDVEGSPLTSTGKMTERFTRTDFGHMNIDVTIEDPKAYTKPWTVTIKHRIAVDTDLIEFICNENEKDVSHYTK
jgi:hypothetical protein